MFVLPGGPGVSSSQAEVNIIDANIVFIDPRGTGLNESYFQTNPGGRLLTSEDLAEDVIAVINFLKPKSYFLYGHSYGTVVATIAASKIEKIKSMYPPQRIILEGTVGEGTTNNIQISEANKLLEKYRQSSQICFDCIINKITTMLNAEEIGTLLFAIFYYGYQPMLLESFFTQTSQSQLKQMASDAKINLPSEGLRLYQEVGCREINSTGITIEAFRNNRLESDKLATCQNFPLSSKYTVTDWPILKTPIIYIQGDSDISTPVSESMLHYNRQVNKNYVCVKNAGHAPLEQIGDCSNVLWKAILSGTSINSAVVQCNNPEVVLTTPEHCNKI